MAQEWPQAQQTGLDNLDAAKLDPSLAVRIQIRSGRPRDRSADRGRSGPPTTGYRRAAKQGRKELVWQAHQFL